MRIRRAVAADTETLLDLWLRAVRATHDFVAADDIAAMTPEHHRRGVGRRLVEHARAGRDALRVDVNEANAAARRFYEACGFAVEGRSLVDDQGRPYPLLHLRWTHPGG